MSRVAPQSGVEHGIGGFGSGLEPGHLRVGNGLEGKTESEYGHAQTIQRTPGHGGFEHRKNRQRDQPGQHRLQREHDDQALDFVVGLIAGPYGLIAAVLGVAPVAAGQIEAQPRCPQGHQDDGRRGAGTVVRRQGPPGQQRAQEKQRPDAVDDTDIALDQAAQPGQKGHADQHGQGADGQIPVKHRVSPSGFAPCGR